MLIEPNGPLDDSRSEQLFSDEAIVEYERKIKEDGIEVVGVKSEARTRSYSGERSFNDLKGDDNLAALDHALDGIGDDDQMIMCVQDVDDLNFDEKVIHKGKNWEKTNVKVDFEQMD